MALLEIGQVIRPHGLAGEVVVSLVTNRLERLEAGSVLVATTPGREFTLEVLSSRPHQRRHLVRFAGVHDHDGAEALRGVLLHAEPLEDPEALFVHDLIGLEVIDQHGTAHGPVRAIQANPASDLLVLDDGYVPMRFVREVQETTVLVEVPDGLFE